MENNKKPCSKCNNTGRIKEKDGTIRICYECLLNGNFDQHDKKLKDASELGIKL
ncbi:MAG: hypothetical protein QW273_02240 [Candidatus Pacearchaeota archaeon]